MLAVVVFRLVLRLPVLVLLRKQDLLFKLLLEVEFTRLGLSSDEAEDVAILLEITAPD